MVKTLYVFVLLCFVVATFLCGKYAYRKAEELHKSIAMLEWVCGFMAFFAIFFAISTNATRGYVYRGMYYLGMDALAIFIFAFVLHYVQRKAYKGEKIGKAVIYLFFAADVVSYVVNCWNHMLFEVIPVGKKHIELTVEMRPAFAFFHITLFYFWLFVSVGLLLHKKASVSRFYRMKYSVIAYMIMGYGILNGVGLLINSTYDLWLMVACTVALIIYYLSIVYIPNGLIGRILIHANQNMKNVMIFFDTNGHCVYINDAGRAFFELKPFQNLDVVEKTFMSMRPNQNFEEMEDGTWEEKKEIKGRTHYIYGSFEKLYDENHICIAGFVMLEDKTEEHEKNEDQRYRATHDLLTGLYNRNRFKDRVTELLEQNKGTQYLMVGTDIKDFKLINDLFGFETGDEVLRTQAEILKTYDFSVCAYSRLTSDKFALCIPKDMFEEEDFLSRMRVMNEKFNNDIFRLHVNVGVYEIQDIHEAPSIMCDKAALAIASRRGDFDDRVAYYDNEVMEKNIRDRKMVAEFDDAIRNEEFIMYLQPQFGTDKKILGCEALVRWQHPRLGLIFPGSFIEVFEKAGLIYKLDAFIWELAARKLAAWKDGPGNELYISVNISVKDFYFIDIYKTFVELVEKYQINPAKLKLEITETALMTEFSANQDVINRLRKYGFIVEIDDFGSGYSSLNMLRKIYADVIKIDMGFLGRDDVDSDRSKIILQAVIGMSNDLKMPSITEGVETEEQFEMLKDMGCGIFQGYFFEKPIPIPLFEEKYVV